MLTQEMKDLIALQRLAYVATVSPDGTPNLSPKGTLTVWDDQHLLFADIRSPQTRRNLQHNPAVEVNVVDPLRRKGFRFKGTATVYADGEPFAAFVAFFRQRGVVIPIRAVVCVRVERALPVTSPAYDLGASEAEVRERWRRYWAERGQP